MSQALCAAPPSLILALGWLVLLVYAYPGQMSQGSFDALRQARTRFFSDTIPPAFSTLWRVVELVIAGPLGMFIVQSACFVIGTYWILRRTLAPARTGSPRAAAWATIALLLVPPVMVPLAEISTASMMAGFLLLGTGALLSDHRHRRLSGLAALFGATAVQPSALVATLPLVLVMFTWRDGVRGKCRFLQSIATWAAITAAALVTNAILAKQAIHVWSSELARADIIGTLAVIDEDVGDAELEIILAGTDLQIAHGVHAAARAVTRSHHDHPRSVTALALWQRPLDGAAPPTGQRGALARAAREIVRAHPLAYLRHRLSVLGELLWITDRYPDVAVLARELPDADIALRAGIPTRATIVQDTQTHWLTVLAAHTPLFVPWVYLVLALVLLPLARRHPDVLAILASGLALTASLLVTATTIAYHQTHWLITCTGLAIIVLTARRARA